MLQSKLLRLKDLTKYQIGTVRAYVNTVDLDSMSAEGKLQIDPVVDDLTILRKLLDIRIQLAVNDQKKLFSLIRCCRKIKSCMSFRKGAEAERLVKIFNEGFIKISVSRIMKNYLKKAMHK